MDVGGLFLTIAFIALGLSLIPINEWLDERARRRAYFEERHQAKPMAKRAFTRWYRQ